MSSRPRAPARGSTTSAGAGSARARSGSGWTTGWWASPPTRPSSRRRSPTPTTTTRRSRPPRRRARIAGDVFFELAIADVQEAADQLRGVYDATGHLDGFVSFELPPSMANDTAASTSGDAGVLGADRPAQHLHQDPGDGRGRARHRGVDRRRHQHQRDAAVLAGQLRGHPLGVHPRAGATGAAGAADRRRALGGQLLRLAGGHGGRCDRCPRDRRCAERRPSPTPSSPTSATSRSRRTIAGRRWPHTAPACSGRCGPPPAPRTRPTRMFSTSTT